MFTVQNIFTVQSEGLNLNYGKGCELGMNAKRRQAFIYKACLL